MRKIIGMMLILAGTSTLAMAGTFVAPEIDPATAVSGLAVLSGAVLVIRSRRKK